MAAYEDALLIRLILDNLHEPWYLSLSLEALVFLVYQGHAGFAVSAVWPLFMRMLCFHAKIMVMVNDTVVERICLMSPVQNFKARDLLRLPEVRIPTSQGTISAGVGGATIAPRSTPTRPRRGLLGG